jgi:hypothetical protein
MVNVRLQELDVVFSAAFGLLEGALGATDWFPS